MESTGRVYTDYHVQHFDRATFVNPPGFLSSVAVFMYVYVRRLLDFSEFAEVIAAIPAAPGRLAAGSRIHFLRLDLMRQPAEPNCASPQPIEIVESAHPSSEPEPMQPRMSVSESWSCLDTWLLSNLDAVPGGLKPEASDDDILILEGALGVKLPEAFIASLKIHNGQSNQQGICFFDETLLDIKGILSEWAVWHGLVVEGAFEGVTSDPDSGIKDDWYNLKWIPLTKDGMGNSVCLDLDPAPGGTHGQVIRVWHDDDRRERVAASYEEWLQWMVMELTDFEPQRE